MCQYREQPRKAETDLVACNEKRDQIAYNTVLFVSTSEREIREDGTSGRVVDTVHLLQHCCYSACLFRKCNRTVLGLLQSINNFIECSEWLVKTHGKASIADCIEVH